MDVLEAIVKTGLTVAVLIGIIVLVAALFMIIFGIATSIDDNIQN